MGSLATRRASRWTIIRGYVFAERAGMRNVWPALVLAALGHITVGAAGAWAQTVYVRQAPPGAQVELVLNGKPVGSAEADARGDAILPMNLSALIGRTEMDANILVDVCGELRRVLINDRGMRPPVPGPGCDRREIIGVFFIRRVSSVVVNVAGVNPSVLLVQGPYDLRDPGPPRAWGPAPTGLVLFGAAGFGGVRDFETAACGTIPECSADGSQGAFNVGASFWLTRFLGAEVSYLRPSQFDARGSGDGFQFTSAFDVELATITGNVGVPIGPVRIYGKVGTNYQRSTFSTTQSRDAQTIVIDGVEQTIEATTQTLVLNTTGWGWYFGGGVDTWITRRVALYGEASRAALRGDAVNGGEGFVDEGLTSLFFGVRVWIAR
jgi:hypothetical protein